MFIIGLGTGLPAVRLTQVEAWQVLAASPAFACLNARSQRLLKCVLHNRDSGIAARYFAPEPLAQMFGGDPDVLAAAFSRHAPLLACAAARNALNDAGLSAADIDGVVVSTCTGYLCPGLSGYLIEGLGLLAERLLMAPRPLMSAALATAADGYAGDWRWLFARRIRSAALFAQIAMNPALAAAAVSLFKVFPGLLTWCADMAGKSTCPPGAK